MARKAVKKSILCEHCDRRFVPDNARLKLQVCPYEDCGKTTGGPKLDIPTAKSRAWREFADYIKLRDAEWTNKGGKTILACICVTCGDLIEYGSSDLHAGHWLGGRTKGVLFSPAGCHGQCRSCNYGMSKPRSNVTDRYTAYMFEHYGKDICKQLIEKKLKGAGSWTVVELETVREVYAKKCAERRVKLGL